MAKRPELKKEKYLPLKMSWPELQAARALEGSIPFNRCYDCGRREGAEMTAMAVHDRRIVRGAVQLIAHEGELGGLALVFLLCQECTIRGVALAKSAAAAMSKREDLRVFPGSVAVDEGAPSH